MSTPERITPGPGQESVWDYPRPPKIESFAGHRILVLFGDQVVADTRGAFKYLETSHPPSYYIPLKDVKQEFLARSSKTTVCEYKGAANYYHLRVGNRESLDAAWYYAKPKPGFEQIANYLAFYPQKVDEANVDGERVDSQAGRFYGGWVTSNIVGPFKGGPGTIGW